MYFRLIRFLFPFVFLLLVAGCGNTGSVGETSTTTLLDDYNETEVPAEIPEKPDENKSNIPDTEDLPHPDENISEPTPQTPSDINETTTVSNDAPVANDDNATLEEDSNATIDVLSNDSDSDGSVDADTLTIVRMPSHGNATIVNGKIHYIPQSNYNGTDRLSYTVKDDSGASSNEANVTIEVTPVNDAPVAYEQNLTTPEDTQLAITLQASEIEADPLHYKIVTQPLHGTLSGTAPDLLYTPETTITVKIALAS